MRVGVHVYVPPHVVATTSDKEVAAKKFHKVQAVGLNGQTSEKERFKWPSPHNFAIA